MHAVSQRLYSTHTLPLLTLFHSSHSSTPHTLPLRMMCTPSAHDVCTCVVTSRGARRTTGRSGWWRARRPTRGRPSAPSPASRSCPQGASAESAAWTTSCSGASPDKWAGSRVSDPAVGSAALSRSTQLLLFGGGVLLLSSSSSLLLLLLVLLLFLDDDDGDDDVD